ncbi:MAG: hypothetical protein WC813_04755 [Patescibacteria group bacterium]|jgi:hypothetical protein
MSSSNYQIQWDSIGQGGENTSTSASYKVRDTFGTIQGVSSSTSFRQDTGFRAGVYDPTVSFSVFSQDTSSQVAATSLVGNVVTITSVVGYAVDDYIAVIQDQGTSQISAIGRVTVVGGSTLTIDELKDGGVAPVIDGSSDFVYKLSGSSLPFNTFSTSVVNTGIVGWDAAADVSSGYSVFLFEDQNLTSGTDTIPDISDGSVTAGVNEYGARSSDTSLTGSTFDTTDSPIIGSFQEVASRADNSLKARDFLTLKVGISGTQPNGTYTQTLTFVFVGNY